MNGPCRCIPCPDSMRHTSDGWTWIGHFVDVVVVGLSG